MIARAARGFALLEVIVAFAIAAGSLLAIFGASSRTAVAAAKARDLTFAVELATSLYAESGVEPYVETPLRTGESAQRFRWRVTTQERQSASSADRPALRLREVDIEVAWLERGMLQTYRLAGLKPVLLAARSP